jgi:hypothetical protein
MRPILLKIFILLLSCCFFTSATETDIGSYHQTFFDDYDTYIPTEQQDFQVADIMEGRQKTILPPALPAIPFLSFLYSNTFSICLPGSVGWLSMKKTRLFLQYSSLLI